MCNKIIILPYKYWIYVRDTKKYIISSRDQWFEDNRSRDFQTLVAAYPVSTSGVVTLQNSALFLEKAWWRESKLELPERCFPINKIGLITVKHSKTTCCLNTSLHPQPVFAPQFHDAAFPSPHNPSRRARDFPEISRAFRQKKLQRLPAEKRCCGIALLDPTSWRSTLGCPEKKRPPLTSAPMEAMVEALDGDFFWNKLVSLKIS